MAEMTKEEKYKKLLTTIEEIPTLPVVITKLLELIENPLSTAREINDVIKTDQSLTAKTLKLVNSAYYGFPRKIGTVTDAVVILGFNTVRSLAVSATVCKLFEGGSDDFKRELLWEHSIAVAFASRIIAKMVRYPEEEEAFVAGILHDIAKVVEDQHLHEYFIKAVIASRERGIQLTEAEKEEIGVDHTIIGRKIADKWNLPLKITKVIGYHHQPQFAGVGDDKTLASIVCIADSIVKIRKIGDSGNYGPVILNKEILESIGLGKKELAEIVQKLIVEIKKAEEFLKIARE